jgi:hypothetical protein
MGYVFVICSIILRCSAHHILTARSLGDTPPAKITMVANRQRPGSE